ncbi:MAG: DUF1616 domain-containing protein [Nitrososphaeria archaeon]
MAWIFDEEVLAVLAAIIIVASVFAVVQAINAGRVVEPFSELGLLGPYQKIGDYPREVVAGSQFLLHSYVGNHEGKTMFYRVLVKVGNRTSVINETMPKIGYSLKRHRKILGKQAKAARNCFYSERKCLIVT